MVKNIRKILSALMAFVGITMTFVVRFSHPQLTETQLLIEFWYWYLLVVLAAIIVPLNGSKE